MEKEKNMKNKKKSKYFKIALIIITILLIAGIAWKLAPLMANLSTTEGQVAFKEQIGNMGFSGGLMLMGLELLQIILVVLPAEPLEVLAGMCYGTWGGTLFITFAAFISTVMIYFLIAKLGKKVLENFMSKEKIDKIENSKFLKNTRRLEIIMFLLFFIPGTPKDLLVYIGALLPIKPIRFIMISTFARFPSIISSTMVGDNITNGEWTISLIIYGVTFLITAVGIYISKKKGGKEANEIMSILK